MSGEVYINGKPIIPISRLSPFQNALGEFIRIPHIQTNYAVPANRYGGGKFGKKYEELAHDMAVEVFWNLYPHESPKPLKTLPIAREIIKYAIDTLAKTGEFKDIKSVCRGDIINSAIMANSIAERLWGDLLQQNLLPDAVAEDAAKEKSEKQEKKDKPDGKDKKESETTEEEQEEEQEGQEEQERPENEDGEPQDGNGQGEPQESQEQEEGQGQNGQGQEDDGYGENGEEQEGQSGSGLSESQKEAIADVVMNAQMAASQVNGGDIGQDVKRMETARGIMRGWGLESAELSNQEIGGVIDAVDKIQGDLPFIIKLMGRLKGVATDKITNAVKERGVIVKDGYTRELVNIFPSELALMRKNANPLVRADKIAQYADRGLLGMVTGAAGEREGCFIAAMDDSGSMYTEGRFGSISKKDPAFNAMALTMGLAMAAKENKQKFTIFKYSSESNILYLNSEDDYKKLCNFMGSRFGGGTDFTFAFNKIMAAIDKYEIKDRNNADVLFITDGECGIDPEVMEKFIKQYKEVYKTRVIGFAINMDGFKNGWDDDRVKEEFIKLIAPLSNRDWCLNNQNKGGYGTQYRSQIDYNNIKPNTLELLNKLFDAVVAVNDISKEAESMAEKLQKLLMH